MFKGEVTFHTTFSGVEFETIEVIPADTDLQKVVITSLPDEGVSLLVEVRNAETYESAIAVARQYALHTAKSLTFEFEVFHPDFRCVKENLTEEQILDGTVKLIPHIICGVSTVSMVDSWMKPSIERLNTVKKLLQKNNSLNSFYYEQFYFALGLIDPLSKFMALYNIVLTLCSDRQEDVDKFVLTVQPNTPTNPPYRSRKSGTQETIYTRLRNQVGHVRTGTTIETTRNEMEQNLSSFIRITKEKIKQSLSKP